MQLHTVGKKFSQKQEKIFFNLDTKRKKALSVAVGVLSACSAAYAAYQTFFKGSVVPPAVPIPPIAPPPAPNPSLGQTLLNARESLKKVGLLLPSFRSVELATSTALSILSFIAYKNVFSKDALGDKPKSYLLAASSAMTAIGALFGVFSSRISRAPVPVLTRTRVEDIVTCPIDSKPQSVKFTNATNRALEFERPIFDYSSVDKIQVESGTGMSWKENEVSISLGGKLYELFSRAAAAVANYFSKVEGKSPLPRLPVDLIHSCSA